MASSTFKFTLSKLQKLSAGGKRKRYQDEANPGLVIDVSPSGRKTFRTVKRNSVTGKLVTVTIGTFPGVTVDMAAKKNSQLVADINNGLDPNEEKRATRARQTTFSELWELYDADFSNKVRYGERRATSQAHNQRLIKNHLSNLSDSHKRALMTRPVVDFTQEYAEAILSILKSEKTKPIYNKCLTLLKSMFNLGVKRQIIVKNPFLGAKKFMDKERKRYLQPEEVEAFFDAVDQEEQIYRDVVRMLLFTGQRKNCVLSMRWEELSKDLSTWTIPTSKMKGKEAHTLPLSRKCIEILKGRAEHQHPSGYVFPARNSYSKTGHIAEKTGENSFWRRITRRAGLYSEDKDKNLTVHDLRRSLASWQINNKVDLYTVSKTLGHKNLTTTQKIYAHLNSDRVREGVTSAVTALELAAANDEGGSINTKLDQIVHSLTEQEKSELAVILQSYLPARSV